MRQYTLAQACDAPEPNHASPDAEAASRVYIVDQDRPFRLALAALLKESGYAVRTYDRAEDFLDDLADPQAGCLLVDVRLPGMSGPELQRAVRRSDMPFGIIFMSRHADIRQAVSAIREGAVDFIEKPFDPSLLLDSVRTAISDARRRYRDRSELAGVRKRFETLTVREREIMRLMIDGYPTKLAARRLGLSPRTVESHRTHVMAKMGTRTLTALVRQGIMLERILGRPDPI